LNNTWNKFIYKVGSPLYDYFFNTGMFLTARKHIFRDISFTKKHKILFIGVGTGADLELINHTGLNITAIDYSTDMLRKARAKFRNSTITFLEMDAQKLAFEDESFDYVVASLILSVVPDENECFKEMVRVLHRDGKIIIFDKFAPDHSKLSFPKMFLRPIISLLGTDIGRSFEEIVRHTSEKIKVEEDIPIMLNAMYRKIMIGKSN
jgi:phosphatidylethanolamine/phosphatidyl-N-methylethanolamine N-methyltransferase